MGSPDTLHARPLPSRKQWKERSVRFAAVMRAATGLSWRHWRGFTGMERHHYKGLRQGMDDVPAALWARIRVAAVERSSLNGPEGAAAAAVVAAIDRDVITHP